MNRLIKFRCWDIDKKLMIECVAHTQRDGLLVMQFTGLIDKLGKEIYDSDILRLKYLDQAFAMEEGLGSHQLAIVYWSEEMGGWWLKYDNWIGDTLMSCKDDCYEAEIVGNIHENPELLEGVKL